MKITVVIEVEKVADIETLQRAVGRTVTLEPVALSMVSGTVKGVRNGDAIKDAQELMDDSGAMSHDGLLA